MPEAPVKYVYSDLVNMIRQGQVKELQVVEAEATAVLADNTKITVVTPGYAGIYLSVGEDIERQIAAGTLRVSTPEPASPPWWLSFLPTLFLIAVMIFFWVIFMKQAQGGGPGGPG